MSASEEVIKNEFKNYFEARNIHLINKCTANGGATECYVLSAAPNPGGRSSDKVGSVVFVTGNQISMAFTTGSPLFENNFDYDKKYQPVPVENCVFGALKLMIEIDQVQRYVDDMGTNAQHVQLLSDNFMKIDKEIIEQSKRGKFPSPERDKLVNFVFTRQKEMQDIHSEREQRPFAWFKTEFLRTRRALLDYLPYTIPMVAKMGVGQNVMYMDFVKRLFEDESYATWAVYFVRLFILRNSLSIHNGVYPLLWHMLHSFGYQQEWSKDDGIWAMPNHRVPEPKKYNGPLCFFKPEFNDNTEAHYVREYIVMQTVFTTGEANMKKLGHTNNDATLRFAFETTLVRDPEILTDKFFDTEAQISKGLKEIEWTDWFNAHFGNDESVPICDSINREHYSSQLLSRFRNATPTNTKLLLEFIAALCAY